MTESLVLDLRQRAAALTQQLISECSKLSVQPGWQSRSNTSDADGLVWHLNHRPPNTRSAERAGRRDVTECIKTDPYRLWNKMWQVVKDVLGDNNLFLVRVYLNVYPYGSEALAHTDSDRGDEITVLVPVHASWHHDWGGETVLIDQCGDVVRSVLPYPGRAFAFRSNILHSARPVTRSAPIVRTMLVFKAGVWPAERPLQATQPDMLEASPETEPGPGESSALWQLASADAKRHTAAALQWVQSSRAAWMRHGHGTLAGHLAATGAWLQAWGADDVTVRGGLAHALFGTGIYGQTAYDVHADRPIIEQVFGTEAVHLAGLFAAIERQSLRDTGELIAQGSQLKWPLRLRSAKEARWAPEAADPVIEDEQTLSSLLLILAANECAQLGRWERVEDALNAPSTQASPEN